MPDNFAKALMKIRRRLKVRHRLLRIAEIILLPVSILAGIFLSLIIRVDTRRWKLTYDWFCRCGFLPVRFHYYQPVVKAGMLPPNYTEIENPLHGIDLDPEGQLKLLGEFNYNQELEKIPFEGWGPLEAYYGNPMFTSGDAEILYSMIRHFKPKKIVEIGSGHSTKFARLAIEKNREETGDRTEHLCIEPYERPWLEKLGVQVIRERVETLDLALFTGLDQGDILFVDSSHVVRTQGDVLFEYLQVFPCLKKGVIVQCHDIFLPREYPLDWIEKNRHFMTEQYLLQGLLTFSSRFKPLLAVNWLAHHHRGALVRCCPALQKDKNGEPSSFWLEVVE